MYCFSRIFFHATWPKIFDLKIQVPSIYINDSNFYEYLGHPKSKFQNALKNYRVEIGVYLLYTKFSIFQCRIITKIFRIFGPVFTDKLTIQHLNSTNLFTGLEFSTCTFLWNQVIVEACHMAHLNPVTLKINLMGWNPLFMH